jgi:hypothetical protein
MLFNRKARLLVYRDNNKNDTIDALGIIEETGYFGVNIHRSNVYRPSVEVGKWSAGCQVLQDPDYFAFLMKLCNRAVEKSPNSFTYTLLERRVKWMRFLKNKRGEVNLARIRNSTLPSFTVY